MTFFTIPDDIEIWERIWQILRGEYGSSLSREESEDLQADFFERWTTEWAEELVAEQVRHWKPWIGRKVKWRTVDYLRARTRHARILAGLGAVDSSRTGDDSTEEWQYSRKEGAINDDGFDDPVEAEEWRGQHASAWSRLNWKHREVLLVWARERMGEITEQQALLELAQTLGLDSLNSNAYQIRVTRAREAIFEQLGKEDSGYDQEFEKILIGRQAKRVLAACRNNSKKASGLDDVEKSAWSVLVEVALGRRARGEAAREAGRRAGRLLGEAGFDGALRSARAKLEAVADGPFYSDRVVMEYLGEKWEMVKS